MAGHDDKVLETLLSDPLTIALMRADRVDPVVLRADLRRVAERVRARGPERSRHGSGPHAAAVGASFLAHVEACGGPRFRAAARSDGA
jgi:hypothetical protein